jgi:hypothetical protein
MNLAMVVNTRNKSVGVCGLTRTLYGPLCAGFGLAILHSHLGEQKGNWRLTKMKHRAKGIEYALFLE